MTPNTGVKTIQYVTGSRKMTPTSASTSIAM